MDKNKVKDIVKRYAELVVSQLLVNKIVLYGSYARGNAKKESDIDIAVIVPKEAVSKNILQDMAKLFTLTRGISSDIEPVLLIDGEDDSGFQEHILSYGELIYSI